MVTTIVEDLEAIQHELAQAIVQDVKTLQASMGPRGYGKLAIPEAEQVEHYLLMRDNREAWVALLREKGIRPVVEYASRMERALRRQGGEGS